MRRDLAELSVRPEGFRFRWRASDGRIYEAPLITPPDMEAVQHADGTWFRTRRPISQSNPPPYSERWYRDYLEYYGLPTYFLRSGHSSMRDDDEEARRLGIFNSPSPQYAIVPRSDYLNLLHDATPFWPQPQNEMYRLELQTQGSRAGLSHYYPALSITQFQYRTYVMSDGHVQLRSMAEPDNASVPVLAENEAAWETSDENQRVPSSYHREVTGLHPHTQPSVLREVAVQAAIDRHAVINPMEDPPGRGRMRFLTENDRLQALAWHYADEQAVNRARRNGELEVGTGENAGPIVAFWPDEHLRNPAHNPTGPGAWRFLTNNGVASDRGFAAINFGSSHGLPAHPTASQIRRLGQLFIADGREDLTEMIDIVWAPNEQDRDPGNDPVLDADVESEEEEAGPPRSRLRRTSPANDNSSPLVSRTAPGAIAGAHQHHDPTNNGGVRGGINDQTGGDHAEYATCWNRGGWVTVDRSRVWPGEKEEHKLWVYGARGWKKWTRADTMDWDDTKKVSDLNKHREQSYQRAGIWERKRPEKREDYTQEELEWVMGLVRDAGGERPATPLEDIAREFNRRFSAHRRRNDSGIQSLIDRLRKEFAQYNGLRPRKGRGWKQQQTSRELRGAGMQDAQEDAQGDVQGGEEGGEEGAVGGDVDGEESLGNESDAEGSSE